MIRWGILGAGGIAGSVCDDIMLSEGSVVTAVAARDAGRAAAFASRYGAERAYGDYAALVADDTVDVVYVATTHPYHREHALMAIKAGKAVLIEKPVCLNAADAREVLDAARAAGVFAMEAMWMKFNPLVRTAFDLVAEGAIGELRGIRAEFGLGLPFDPAHRLYDIANGGGALLDLGVYPATLAHLFLGRPDTIRTSGALATTGTDDTAAMEWLYGGIPRAHLWCSVSTAAPNQAAILGSGGWITLDGVCRPSAMTLHRSGTRSDYPDPLIGQGHGYGPQIAEVERCLREGLLESPLVTHAASVEILELLDAARSALGVTYPSEQKPAAARDGHA